MRDALEPQNIRFNYPGESPNAFYAMEHLTFTFMSDFTYNRVGYLDIDIDDIDALGLGESINLTPEEQGKLDRADALQEEHGSRASCSVSITARPASWPNEREDALLEYLTMRAELLLGRLQHPRDELVDQRDSAAGHR